MKCTIAKYGCTLFQFMICLENKRNSNPGGLLENFMKERRVTITSIATELGLSRNTVSMALRNDPRVAEETRQRITNYVRSSGYTKFTDKTSREEAPDRPLRILALRRPDSSPYWDRILNGLSEEASLYNCNISIAVVTQKNIDELQLPYSPNEEIDACFFLHKFGTAYTQKVLKKKMYSIFLDREVYTALEPTMGDVIKSESRRATMELTLSLIRQGMTRIAYLNPFHVDGESFCDRFDGYRDAMTISNLPLEPQLITTPSPFPLMSSAVRSAFEQLMIDPPQAVVCVNDISAMCLSEMIIKEGLRIPQDIAITGFDNDEANSFQPFFTTVDCHAHLLGKRMIHQLLWRIKHPDAPYETITVQGEIIYRASSQRNVQSNIF